MAEPTAGFLAERLAKASAVPPEQRSADVRAFIETCQLQTELVEELGLPEVIDKTVLEGLWDRWTAAPALKLVRSHMVSACSGRPLQHTPQLHTLATIKLHVCASTGTDPSNLGPALTDLLEGDPGLETFAILAAGLPFMKLDRGESSWRPKCCASCRKTRVSAACLSAGLLEMSNSAVALMRRPAVRRRLQSELAALPQHLVSYEELLAFFIDYGADVVNLVVMKGDLWAGSADVRTAIQLAADLLPQLAPDNPRLRFRAATMAKLFLPAQAAAGSYLPKVNTCLDVARQQGSDFFTACCGYMMAISVEDWIALSAVRQGLPPPSAVLGWLQQAEAAHRRCKAVLPKLWTRELDSAKVVAAPASACLQRLQQQGDRWCRLAPAAQQELKAAVQEYWDNPPLNKMLTCSGCGKCAPQLRVCGACREAQYCR